ncbi:MAG: CRISPR-associated protein Csm4 [Moraxellaceae bacterium]|nr:CRISPR-associated protein Csm4 [Pseudomonadales bacterium]MCP5175158.1 CRISPR-associated protein Csm4 [Moraxellaceae bacterium]MCP5177348.1 CRISPR-associated protein Csm4 [Moraxellaceae bacterium]
MTSTLLKITLQPQSPFVTPLASDTLFGQLCWTIRHSLGEATLHQLLEGYTQGKPFVVLSDALPQAHIPRPSVPLSYLGYQLNDPKKRKQIKSQTWLPLTQELLCRPLSQWHADSISLADIVKSNASETKLACQSWQTVVSQPHNSLNRLTNRTGKDGGFSPFSRQAHYYHPSAQYDVYVVLDEQRLSQAQLKGLLQQLGTFGYGKEASTGAGKFVVGDLIPINLNKHSQANAYLSLGHAAPQGHAWQTEHCYYNTTVRFGRHGAEAVYIGSPFKNPTMLTTAGAIFSPSQFEQCLFVGQGLTGVSNTIKTTVQQGYAPVLPVYFDSKD